MAAKSKNVLFVSPPVIEEKPKKPGLVLGSTAFNVHNRSDTRCLDGFDKDIGKGDFTIPAGKPVVAPPIPFKNARKGR